MQESRLRELREAAGLTQEQVAEATGIARSTIAAYEVGGRRPHGENVRTLAEFFRVPADYLLGTNMSRFVEETGDARRIIDNAIADSPDPIEDLIRMWKAIRGRPELQHLITQLSEFDDDTIHKVIRVIGALELGDGTHNT